MPPVVSVGTEGGALSLKKDGKSVPSPGLGESILASAGNPIGFRKWRLAAWGLELRGDSVPRGHSIEEPALVSGLSGLPAGTLRRVQYDRRRGEYAFILADSPDRRLAAILSFNTVLARY